MKTLVIGIIFMNIMLVSCSEKKSKSPFSKIPDYCEMEEAEGDPYCDLGVHHKTLEDIMLMYGTPIENTNGEEYLMLFGKDPKNHQIDGGIETSMLVMLFSNFKDGKASDVKVCTWAPYEDKDIWIRIYFVKDELNQFRAIYGTKAPKRVFFLE